MRRLTSGRGFVHGLGVGLTLPLRPYSSHASSGSSGHHPHVWAGLGALVVTTGGIATLSLSDPARADSSGSNGDRNKSNKMLAFEETVYQLKQMLTPIRNRMRAEGVPSHQLPYMFVERDYDEDDDDVTDSGNKDRRNGSARRGAAFHIRLRVDCNSAKGMAKWVALLKGPISFKADPEGFTFTSKDGASQVRCESEGSRSRLLFIRRGGFTRAELDGVVAAYPDLLDAPSLGPGSAPSSPDDPRDIIHNFGSPNEIFRIFGMAPGGGDDGGPFIMGGGVPGSSSGKGAIGDPKSELEKLGVTIYDAPSNMSLTWDHLIGYDKVKRDIKDTVINYLQFPEVYDAIVKATRRFEDTSRPRALLFEGPPGTGKTLSARVVAGQCGKPMVHLPLESVVSKWYGDSEKKLSKILDACEALGGCIIFIDEVDALAPSRGGSGGGGGAEGSAHEVTRRILSVLLQRLEGFQGRSKNIIVCATNRKQDLDAALISRFNVIIRFDLPDMDTRKGLFSMYAKHLSEVSCKQLASSSAGVSCRGIKDVCEQTERVVASRLIEKRSPSQSSGGTRGEIISPSDLPTIEDYATQLDKYKAGHMHGSGHETVV